MHDELNGADLNNANLTGANLTGLSSGSITGTPASLPQLLINGYLVGLGANLTGANLTGADLNNANLTGASLLATNLDNADLTNANLSRANIFDASFRLLTNANLTSASLFGSWFTNTNLELFLVALQEPHQRLESPRYQVQVRTLPVQTTGADLYDATSSVQRTRWCKLLKT